MSTIVLGDIHGSAFWKTAIAENPDCRYIFLGDYLDGKDNIDSEVELDNLKEIISFKKENPDNVILLLGNHDLLHRIPDIKDVSVNGGRVIFCDCLWNGHYLKI